MLYQLTWFDVFVISARKNRWVVIFLYFNRGFLNYQHSSLSTSPFSFSVVYLSPFGVGCRSAAKDLFLMSRTKIHVIFPFVLAGLLAMPGIARPQTVSFPIYLDYPLLRALVVAQAFPGEGDSVMLSDPTDACRHLILSNPVFQEAFGLLKLKTDLRMQGGMTLGDRCWFSTSWEGGLVVYLKPRLNPLTWQLTFQTVSSELVDKRDKRPLVMGNLWAIFQGMVMDYLGGTSIDLAPPLRQFRPLILQMVKEEDAAAVEKMIETLRPGEMATGAGGIRIDFLADVEIPPPGEAPPAPPLTGQELADFIDIWEAWDAFLVETLMTLAFNDLDPEEQGILLGMLLDVRYQFIHALETDAASDDFVRKQFTAGWETLSPILRRHFDAGRVENPAGFLAFFTAASSLAILDRVGPAFDVEISRNGLINLVRMLSADKDVLLAYAPEVDPGLRRLLGMGPPIETSGPVFDLEELLLDPSGWDGDEDTVKAVPEAGDAADEHGNDRGKDAVEENDDRGGLASVSGERSFFHVFLTGQFPGGFKAMNLVAPRSCMAAELVSPADLAAIRRWLVSEANLAAYLADIRKIIEEARQQKLSDSRIPPVHHEVFHNILYATAWQESCFRQFIEEKGSITYLRSYNNTSIGMMQINERVWRGIYDTRRLKWDIAYNVKAGVEIADEYMTRYALPRMEKLAPADALNADGLAGAVYAMYNSGPGDFSRYIERRRSGSFRATDLHFKEKYDWVKTNQWRKLGLCLFGRE
jgi:hypothetical protein